MEFGIWSIIPPILTIGLALFTKNVFISLFIGAFVGYSILNQGNIILGMGQTLNGMAKTLESNGNTICIFSILIIGAMIYIVEKSGGIDGFVDIMVRKKALIKNKRASMFFTWLIGLCLFTSGTLSTMVTGSVSRPINDSMKVSHEKAAFIVHSTSTPVCAILPLSGWLGGMIGWMVSGGVAEDQALMTLIKSIGLNFYCLLAVFGCMLLCITGKDFGPMRKAELRAETTGALDAKVSAEPVVVEDNSRISGDVPPRMRNLVIPMAAMIATVIATLLITGGGSIMKGNSNQALLWGVFVSIAACGVLCVSQKLYTVGEFINVAFTGASNMLPMAAILVLAFNMSGVISGLGTGSYLASLFSSFLTPALLPALVFILSCLISFATGTSLGTMSTMCIIAIPMAIQMDVNIPLVASAVWGGSIFGDHASPISDTTIMSCGTTGCDIMDHIKTQFPYCLTFAVITVILYLMLGFVM